MCGGVETLSPKLSFPLLRGSGRNPVCLGQAEAGGGFVWLGAFACEVQIPGCDEGEALKPTLKPTP